MILQCQAPSRKSTGSSAARCTTSGSRTAWSTNWAWRPCQRGSSAQRCCFWPSAVGDVMYTDVLGARDAGLASALVAGGVHHAELGVAEASRALADGGRGLPESAAVEAFLSRYEYRPDHLLGHPVGGGPGAGTFGLAAGHYTWSCTRSESGSYADGSTKILVYPLTWSAIFPVEQGWYDWNAEKVDGYYADAHIKIVIIATNETDLHDLETQVDVGETIPLNVGTTLHFSKETWASHFKIYVLAGTSHIAVFAKHFPTDFEGAYHYLLSANGEDIEPVAEESDAACESASESTSTDDSKIWGEVILAAFVTVLPTLIGIVLVVMTCMPTLKAMMAGEGGIVAVVHSFASGVIFAAAAYLLLPEGLYLITVGKREAGGSGMWGASVLAGWCSAAVIKQWCQLVTGERSSLTLPTVNGEVDEEPQKSRATNWLVSFPILFGDMFHNFSDGLVLGVSCKTCGAPFGRKIAWVTVRHEFPQELSDFAVLITKRRMAWPMALTLFGAIITYSSDVSSGVEGATLAAGAEVYLHVAMTQLGPAVGDLMGDGAFGSVARFLNFAVGATLIGLVLDQEHCYAPVAEGGEGEVQSPTPNSFCGAGAGGTWSRVQQHRQNAVALRRSALAAPDRRAADRPPLRRPAGGAGVAFTEAAAEAEIHSAREATTAGCRGAGSKVHGLSYSYGGGSVRACGQHESDAINDESGTTTREPDGTTCEGGSAKHEPDAIVYERGTAKHEPDTISYEDGAKAKHKPNAISYDVRLPKASRLELDADVLQEAVVNGDAEGVAYWLRDLPDCGDNLRSGEKMVYAGNFDYFANWRELKDHAKKEARKATVTLDETEPNYRKIRVRWGRGAPGAGAHGGSAAPFAVPEFEAASLSRATFDGLVREGRVFVVRGAGASHPMRGWDCAFFQRDEVFSQVEAKREYSSSSAAGPAWLRLSDVVAKPSDLQDEGSGAEGLPASPYYLVAFGRSAPERRGAGG
ncbi:unnamed protein product [Prorocentrum cordatum]|uniref:Uncharacterized protein n=1 Tax=Prorocentrum cordatum TaxID=2364126 RepID=A0ABN9VI63_9DINO|nr:unnamed protein product [Polarella glacialis]